MQNRIFRILMLQVERKIIILKDNGCTVRFEWQLTYMGGQTQFVTTGAREIARPQAAVRKETRAIWERTPSFGP